MSVCTFIASDHPLPEATPSQEYPLVINVDNGTIYDGGADDNYFLYHFLSVSSYTDKKYGVYLEWNATKGRASKIVSYIENALQYVDCVELWHVWLMDYYEFEDRPVIHRRSIAREELTADDILKIDDLEIWNTPDRAYPERPSFYCWKIYK